MKLMKEPYFVCAIKTSAVFFTFKHTLSIVSHCINTTRSVKAAVKLLSFHFMSSWITEIWHIEESCSEGY